MGIRDWTLRTKVILHVVVLGVTAAVILTILYVSTQRRLLTTLADQKAELVGTLVMDSIFTLKKCGRVEESQAKVHELVEASGVIRRIRILTTDARIFVSNDPLENGSLLSPEERTNVRTMIQRHTPRQISHVREDGTIRALMLVENRPECYSCHAASGAYNGFLDVRLDTAESAAILRASQWKGVAVALVALAVLTVIILRLFERLINRPITRLRQGMARVQDGDLLARLHSSKRDEIGRLTESFNVMVERLRAANRKIEDLYQERIDRAEHLAAFGELAAGLAHEVRNPLSGIKGALEIINRATPADDPRKDIFDEILRQTDKIISVIQDFLSYARPRPFQARLVSPNLFVENAVRLAETQVRGKEIFFDISYVPENFRISLDADKMQEVVLNLLLNAVAAIETKGRISVTLRTDPGGALEIAVTDDGAGIKESHLGQIFAPFFSTKKGGTGLGLSICRKTVETHGGTISVESAEGRGTTFTIRIPASGPEGR